MLPGWGRSLRNMR